MLEIQHAGRVAAQAGVRLEENPYTDDIERQYWEYGWIEESFLEEINEHRAIMDYAGVQVFQIVEKINDLVSCGQLTKRGGDILIASLSTVAGKLADKLRGG